MHSIHFHIHMLDKKHIQPASAIRSTEAASPEFAETNSPNPSSQYPHLLSPINKHDAPVSPDCPAAH